MRSQAERIIRGLAISGASSLALTPDFPGVEAAGPIAPPEGTHITDKEKRSGMSRLVLRMVDSGALMLNAGHTSHRSHSSHRSSSGGYSPPAPSTPAPVYTPPPPPPPAPPAGSSALYSQPSMPPITVPPAFPFQKEDIRRIAVKITEIDLEKNIIKGADELDMVFSFTLFDESQLVKLSPKEEIRAFGVIKKGKPPSFLKVGEKVVIDWWPDTEAKKRILVRMIVL